MLFIIIQYSIHIIFALSIVRCLYYVIKACRIYLEKEN